jgi:hypothetical protein
MILVGWMTHVTIRATLIMVGTIIILLGGNLVGQNITQDFMVSMTLTIFMVGYTHLKNLKKWYMIRRGDRIRFTCVDGKSVKFNGEIGTILTILGGGMVRVILDNTKYRGRTYRTKHENLTVVWGNIEKRIVKHKLV